MNYKISRCFYSYTKKLNRVSPFRIKAIKFQENGIKIEIFRIFSRFAGVLKNDVEVDV